jgi:glycosyltransferase involved in cell wall biosynthesis
MHAAQVYLHQNNAGLSRHAGILREVLVDAGFQVAHEGIPVRRRGERYRARVRSWLPRQQRTRLNVFVESLVPAAFHTARRSAFMPMQEWFEPTDWPLLPLVDVILCNSREAARLFADCGAEVHWTGFTSVDRLDPTWDGPQEGILHVAGRSEFKGTAALIACWRRHPEWPMLTVVGRSEMIPGDLPANVTAHRGLLTDEALRALQNDAWLHLQPSEAEGFGHCIVEALSVGGVVISTDAPPMTEVVTPATGFLVPWTHSSPMGVGTRYFVDVDALEATIQQVLESGKDGQAARRQAARQWFVDNDRRFRRDTAQLLHSL